MAAPGKSWHQRFWVVQLMLGLIALMGFLLLMASGERLWGGEHSYMELPQYRMDMWSLLLRGLGIIMVGTAFIAFIFLDLHWHYSSVKEAFEK